MDRDLAQLQAQFNAVFGDVAPSTSGRPRRVRIIRAPGRVNLIGEHTDYNDGFVFPMAIEPEVLVACRRRDDAVVRITSTVFAGDVVEISLQQPIKPGEPTWANYSRGVVAELLAAGVPLGGADLLIANTLPVGGGLSSSAAIEVGTALALLLITGTEDMDRGRLALLCQKAEHEFAGVPVGIMDQTAVAASKAGHAMLLDCRDYSKRFIAIDPRDLRVVVANTMVKHELSGGEYAKRRAECEQGVAAIKKLRPEVKALRDVTMSQLDQVKADVSEVVYRRCRHVIGENLRTTEAAGKLARQAYEEVGELMRQSHQSLRDDYEVSCRELDFMVEEAGKVKGVYGARMTGGGFGGCIVALVQPRAVESLIVRLKQVYEPKFGIEPSVFATTATAGAGPLE
jgi:galactokinase